VDKGLIRVSKYLAKYLRHSPHELGLPLQPGGWVPVDDLLDAARRHGFPIDYDELVECVETNDKQRFSFDETGELIRANQGHSASLYYTSRKQVSDRRLRRKNASKGRL
jgi:putative RNA 2'-phosphotransferase